MSPCAIVNSTAEQDIALLLVSHPGIAEAMLDTANAILARKAPNIACLPVAMDCDTGTCEQTGMSLIDALDTRRGLLLLTDVHGATPANVAASLARQSRACVLSGLNLPMLLRLLNYRHENLEQLIDRALEGGRRGIEKHEPS